MAVSVERPVRVGVVIPVGMVGVGFFRRRAQNRCGGCGFVQVLVDGLLIRRIGSGGRVRRAGLAVVRSAAPASTGATLAVAVRPSRAVRGGRSRNGVGRFDVGIEKLGFIVRQFVRFARFVWPVRRLGMPVRRFGLSIRSAAPPPASASASSAAGPLFALLAIPAVRGQFGGRALVGRCRFGDEFLHDLRVDDLVGDQVAIEFVHRLVRIVEDRLATSRPAFECFVAARMGRRFGPVIPAAAFTPLAARRAPTTIGSIVAIRPARLRRWRSA